MLIRGLRSADMVHSIYIKKWVVIKISFRFFSFKIYNWNKDLNNFHDKMTTSCLDESLLIEWNTGLCKCITLLPCAPDLVASKNIESPPKKINNKNKWTKTILTTYLVLFFYFFSGPLGLDDSSCVTIDDI